jgi:hypothetical protein
VVDKYVNSHCVEGRKQPIRLDWSGSCPSSSARKREIRHISMVPHIHAWLHTPVQNQRLQDVKSAARVHFGEFVKENHIDDCQFMKQIEDRRGSSKFGHGVWSFRPLFEPQHRLFGVFACPDWVLILSKQPRGTLINDLRWHMELEKTVTIWENT